MMKRLLLPLSLGLLVGYFLVVLLPVIFMLWIKLGMEDIDPTDDCDGYMERESPTPPSADEKRSDAFADAVITWLGKKCEDK